MSVTTTNYPDIFNELKAQVRAKGLLDRVSCPWFHRNDRGTSFHDYRFGNSTALESSIARTFYNTGHDTLCLCLSRYFTYTIL